MAHVVQNRNVHRDLVEKPEGERGIGRSRSRWKDSIKMNLKEIGTKGVYWIHLTRAMDKWRALADMVMENWVP